MEMSAGSAWTLRVAVGDQSRVGETRRLVASLARVAGFDEAARSNVSIVATEIATNLVKHAREGEVLARLVERGAVMGVEILSLDRGPGMANVTECLRDGFSTAGSPGTGLGAIVRIAHTVDVSSTPAGTALVARLWAAPREEPREPVAGAVCIPKSGEEVCGDAWAVREEPGRRVVMVADGLGHGPNAAEASRAAVDAFQRAQDLRPAAVLDAAHRALRSTRGAAIAVASVDFGRGEVTYAGVGNISGAVVTLGASRQMVSLNGTIGHEARKIQQFVYPWAPSSMLVMHSDGLTAQWRLDKYPGLVSRDPALVAGTLYRDFSRGRDDATVVALREDAE
jgi:anti-sigma regulatory factor (Ser/Thr protein kinase)